MSDFLSQTPGSNGTGITDLINATKGQVLNTGALASSTADLVEAANVQAEKTADLVTASNTQATNTANLVTSTNSLVTSTNSLVTAANTQATNTASLVTATNNLVTAFSDLATAINATIPAPSAWTTWSPTVTAGTGTITTLGTIVASYMQSGKTVYFSVSVTITTNGTGASYINITLPAVANSKSTFTGVDSVNNYQLSGYVSSGTSTMVVRFYAGNYPGSNGNILTVSGVYEAQ